MIVKKVSLSGKDYDPSQGNQVFEYIKSIGYTFERIESQWAQREQTGTLWLELSGVVCWIELEFSDYSELKYWHSILPIACATDEALPTEVYRAIRDILKLDEQPPQ